MQRMLLYPTKPICMRQTRKLLTLADRKVANYLNPNQKDNVGALMARHYSAVINEVMKPLLPALEKYAKQGGRYQEYCVLSKEIKTSEEKLRKIFTSELAEHFEYYRKRPYVGEYMERISYATRRIVSEKQFAARLKSYFRWEDQFFHADGLIEAMERMNNVGNMKLKRYLQAVEYSYYRYLSELVKKVEAFEDLECPYKSDETVAQYFEGLVKRANLKAAV